MSANLLKKQSSLFNLTFFFKGYLVEFRIEMLKSNMYLNSTQIMLQFFPDLRKLCRSAKTDTDSSSESGGGKYRGHLPILSLYKREEVFSFQLKKQKSMYLLYFLAKISVDAYSVKVLNCHQGHRQYIIIISHRSQKCIF